MTKYTVVKPFFHNGEMFVIGDSVELNDLQATMCSGKIISYRTPKEAKKTSTSTSTRKPTNRQAKVDSVREDD